MKRSKDRLHKVIVIGATPAGITATNKLGELGVPVTLVDTDSDMDKKLSNADWTLKSGLPFNHAHRPGLIRMIRNSGIDCIMPAEVTSIKHTPQGFRVRINKIQTFVDPEKCTLCGRCVQICPVNLSNGEKAIKINSRRSLPGRAVIDKRRQPVCQANCPLGVNAQGYIALTRAGRFDEALKLIRKDNILPGICGRVCTHPCEDACRRADLDEPVSIRGIKRFLADYELENASEIQTEVISAKRAEKVAVIGSGPSGLAAASDLARFGYQVTVFEKEDKPGGLLQYAIGPHRLPKDILDSEINYIRRLGVNIVTGRSIDLKTDLDDLRKEYNAVICAIGTWADQSLGAPGEDLEGVDFCLPFLKAVCNGGMQPLGGTAAVIGGGNSAVDVARALVRLGVTPTIVYRRRQQDMPADPEEIKAALEEGIQITDCTQVIGFRGRAGRLKDLECLPTRPGEPDDRGIPRPVIDRQNPPMELPFDRAFIAIGQQGTLTENDVDRQMTINGKGLFKVDEFLHTPIKGVYAAGDAVSGPTSVVDAMKMGRNAAGIVHQDLSGKRLHGAETFRPEDRDFPEIATDIPFQSRPMMAERQPAVRITNFSEVELGLNQPQVLMETERCLQCGVCSECLECVDVCQAIGAINHRQQPEEIIEHAGALIIADPDIIPNVKGEDIIRAYGPRTATQDAYSMMVRGFAAAADVMTLLDQTANRPKGHGISFSPPDPGLSPEIRIGVFVCRCNDSMGWMDGMSQYIDKLTSMKDVVHAEEIPAACIPEGTTQILRMVREKGITRLVLASCVCCPLNFVCSACTDQRSRLKHFLFDGTGISRSMVETCNLRGEVLRLIQHDPLIAMKRFSGFIDRSIRRSRTLKALSAPARNYNFTTAVIGGSESSVSSAMSLAKFGLEVFWFTSPGSPLHEELERPNIHVFDKSAVKSMSGSLGNFQIHMESGDFHQTFQVGAVILGEKSRKAIPFMQAGGLPVQIKVSYQKKGVPGIPFFYPGATSIPGLFLSDPPGVNVSKRKKGAAAAILAAAVMPRGPRQSKGFTVVIDEALCRGCGRCLRACPYKAVSLNRNAIGGWCASVDEALCKGCGNCISVCPSNAADSPYRNQKMLEQTLQELLGESTAGTDDTMFEAIF